MSDKNIKPVKPTPVKPTPVKPTTPRPLPVTPVKAQAHETCIRCGVELNAYNGRVRALCTKCDHDLQIMHWELEHKLYGKTSYYIPGEEPSLEWLKDNGYASFMFKPFKPNPRNFYRANHGQNNPAR